MSALAPSESVALPAHRRPPGSRVRHGQASCADYGCTLPACRQAARRARHQRKRDHVAGLTSKVDPTPAAAHAALLRRHGMSAQDIADASGVSVTLIRRLLRPSASQPGQIFRTTADAILGIPAIPLRIRQKTGGAGLTEAAHAAEILTALAEAGWPARYLAAGLGVSTQTIAAIRNRQRPRLRIRLDQRIRHLYPQLAATTPTAAGIRPGDTARARAYHGRRHTPRS
jgi:lambda repressor-like predicted transcriptional regulator